MFHSCPLFCVSLFLELNDDPASLAALFKNTELGPEPGASVQVASFWSGLLATFFGQRGLKGAIAAWGSGQRNIRKQGLDKTAIGDYLGEACPSAQVPKCPSAQVHSGTQERPSKVTSCAMLCHAAMLLKWFSVRLSLFPSLGSPWRGQALQQKCLVRTRGRPGLQGSGSSALGAVL